MVALVRRIVALSAELIRLGHGPQCASSTQRRRSRYSRSPAVVYYGHVRAVNADHMLSCARSRRRANAAECQALGIETPISAGGMRENLLAPDPILLPDDPAAGKDPLAADTLFAHPDSPAVWANRAVQAINSAQTDDEKVSAYALARTGYHRSLDRLRANGWRGAGPVPYSHEPNQPVLLAIASLARAAQLIGETGEYERCRTMIEEADPTVVDELI